MTLLQVIVLAIVQGVTEFLPISSTAHLVLVPWLFGWTDPGLTFDVALHAGTLVAVLAYFARDWLAMLASLLKGEEPKAVPTWNAVCLADFGDDGIAFIAQPQIPPRNVNWSSQGLWVHAAKIGFEKYFLHKIRQGKAETFYEDLVLDTLGIKKLKDIHMETAE